MDRDDGLTLAVEAQAGAMPTLMFLPGFRSDMSGSKAQALARHAATRGQGMLRFDYSGHGQSGGRFEDGTIGRWRDDALAVIDQRSQGPLLLVGSSMGGWIALLAALARSQRVAGLVLIAPAPDFTGWGLEAPLTAAEQQQLSDTSAISRASDYDPEPTIITRKLIEEGREHSLLHAPVRLSIPVRILHGQQDPDVPWQRSVQLVERLQSADVQLLLVKDGDHRLSRPQDIALLLGLVDGLLETMTHDPA